MLFKPAVGAAAITGFSSAITYLGRDLYFHLEQL
jgi:hypothetical protein